jgi:hypothetical protein
MKFECGSRLIALCVNSLCLEATIRTVCLFIRLGYVARDRLISV